MKTLGMNNINVIKANHLCYGCGTCNVICSQQAISMHYDNIGMLLPTVDVSKCTNCGLCLNHCPSIDLQDIQLSTEDKNFVGHVEHVYIGKATDKKIFEHAQSGGLLTATVKYLFDTGQIDAAVMCCVEDAIAYTPRAVVITSPADLYSCQKSSYVPIDIVSALKDAQQYHAIAIVGTGCHIQGIKAIQNFRKNYREKIKYTLGLICDRTLCKTITDVIYGNYFKGEAKRIIWRDKSLDYESARVLIQTKNHKIKEIPRWQRFALKDSFTNPRCRICFDKLNTHADVVFGDPWGMDHVDWHKGASLVITRSEKGEKLIQEVNHRVAELENAQLEAVLQGQQIEKRKKDVASAMLYYKNQKWLLPSYAEKLIGNHIDKTINALIERFLAESVMPKAKIIERQRIFLKKTKIQSDFKFMMLIPFLVFSKLRKFIK